MSRLHEGQCEQLLGNKHSTFNGKLTYIQKGDMFPHVPLRYHFTKNIDTHRHTYTAQTDDAQMQTNTFSTRVDMFVGVSLPVGGFNPFEKY